MIKATFPAGLTEVTVHGLHQWDYGQVLEIHDSTLPTMLEIHFEWSGVREAEVRVCEASKGVAQVTIPDRATEQKEPVKAWVYEVGTTSGETIRCITLPIVARLKPANAATVPEAVYDKYTEAVGAMNAAVQTVAAGGVTVAEATHAVQAENAYTAGHAETAGNAATADSVKGAGTTFNGSPYFPANIRHPQDWQLRNRQTWSLSGVECPFFDGTYIASTAGTPLHVIVRQGNDDNYLGVIRSALLTQDASALTKPQYTCFPPVLVKAQALIDGVSVASHALAQPVLVTFPNNASTYGALANMQALGLRLWYDNGKGAHYVIYPDTLVDYIHDYDLLCFTA